MPNDYVIDNGMDGEAYLFYGGDSRKCEIGWDLVEQPDGSNVRMSVTGQTDETGGIGHTQISHRLAYSVNGADVASKTVTETIMYGHGNGFSVHLDVPRSNANGAFTFDGLTIKQWTFLNHAPTCSVSASGVAAGRSATVTVISADEDGDAVTGALYRYYKPAGSQEFTGTRIGTITSSGTKTFADAIPASHEGGTVYYYAVVTDALSATTTASSPVYQIVENSTPSVPASLTVPSSVAAGATITVSWGASIDPDGNLEGYILQKSVDGGLNWTNIYQGTALSTTGTIVPGTVSVMYRVCAYDTYGAQSAWRTSAQIYVSNNTAPSDPPFITVPAMLMAGGSYMISWGASTDPDGNLAGYKLYRSTDNGATWSSAIYTGTGTSYTDTVGASWTQVKYRVCAYDTDGAESGYTVSPNRAVTSNHPPVITLTPDTTDYGTVTAGFSFAYDLSDDEHDDLTVTETLDGRIVRTATISYSGGYAQQTVDLTGAAWLAILNGDHVYRISVSDGSTSDFVEVRFDRQVTAASVTLSQPVTASDTSKKITVCTLAIVGDIPSGATMTVKVTNNGSDPSPVWETYDVSQSTHTFANASASAGYAFNFKVELDRGTSAGGYISSVSGAFNVAS